MQITRIRALRGPNLWTRSTAIEAIVQARQEGGPFKSFFDFCARIDRSRVNKRAVEALIGALTLMYIVLGMFIDGISMIVLTTVVVLPMVQKAGFDLVWFGIFVVILVEMAQVSPPVGFNLFVLQSMSGHDSNKIARAALPFFMLLVAAVGIITVFPNLVMILPRLVFSS